MARGKSHTIEYKDSANVTTLIEIWEEGYVGAVTDCEAAEDPLNVDVAPMDPNLYIPVIGSGAMLSVLSVTNGQFLGMYTKSPLKKQVRIFKDNKANPWWLGYVNTEQYSEEYSLTANYPVSIQCNNGFNILDRFKYIDGVTQYSTLETFWNVLTRILGKTGLPYQYIYFVSKLSCTDVVVGATESLFHQLKADQLNYYDEQDEPMTYRAVLEAILSVYGLQIRQEEGSIFVYEPSMLADANFSAKRFNGTTYAYIDDVVVSRNFDISAAQTNWAEEDQVLDTVAGYSRQKIRYSPYAPDGAIEEIDVANRFLWTGNETWTADIYGILRLSGINSIAGMTLANCAINGFKRDSNDEEDIYIQSTSWLWERLLITVSKGFKVAQKAGQFLWVSGEVYVRSKSNETSESEASVTAKRIEIPLNIEIDGKGAAYDPDVLGWYWDENYDPTFLRAYVYKKTEDATICDKWMTFGAAIPWKLTGGKVVLKIWDPEVFNTGARLAWNDGMKAARFKNIKIHVLEGGNLIENGWVYNAASGKEVINEDLSYKIELDGEFMNEAPEITLLHGDAKNITDRGAIRKADNSFTTGWRKPGDASDLRLADILLRALASQYQDTMASLSGTMEADALMGVNGGPNFLHTVQDTDYLGTKKLVFTGGSYNDFFRTINGSWLEVKEEDVTITVE